MKSFMAFTPASQANYAVAAILSIVLLSSCSDPATVGLELAPGNNQIGVFFEEFELPAEMILLDSFSTTTTNEGLLVVGNEEDNFFGKTDAIGYSRLFISSAAARPATSSEMDSMLVRLSVVSVNGQNLTEPKRYTVHRLTESILDTAYYNFDALPFETEPFSSGEVVFGEKKDTIISFHAKEEFAAEIFSKLKQGNEFNDLFSFRDYFPGIAVKATEGDNTTVGVTMGTNTGIVVYYHNEGDTVQKQYLINTSNSRGFNGIKSDRSGTPTGVITEPGKAYDVGGLVGMKANVGLALKLDTSPFDAFLDSLSGITFNQVSLEIGEIQTVPTGQTPPASLIIYLLDESDKILKRPSDGANLLVQMDGQLQVSLDEQGNQQPASGAPAAVFYSSDSKNYVQSVASHINAVFREQLQRKNWMLYIENPSPQAPGDDFKRSLRQFIVGKDKIKVKVIYSKSR